MAWGHHIVTVIWINIGLGNDLFVDGIRPLPKPMLTHHQDPVTFSWGQFHKRLKSASKLCKQQAQIPLGQAEMFLIIFFNRSYKQLLFAPWYLSYNIMTTSSYSGQISWYYSSMQHHILTSTIMTQGEDKLDFELTKYISTACPLGVSSGLSIVIFQEKIDLGYHNPPLFL